MAIREPVEHNLILADGRRIHARRYPGRGETIILLHGLLDSCEGFEDLARNSARPMVVFDLPGFGKSDPPTAHSIVGYGQDIADGLDLLEIDRWITVGHSFGGAVGAALTELRPEQTEALLLIAPAGFGRQLIAEGALLPGIRQVLEIAVPVSLGSRAATSAVYTQMVANGQRPDAEALSRLKRSARSVMPGTAMATRAIASCGHGDKAFFRRRVNYDGPVYALWGDKDRLVPLPHIDGVKTAFPQAEVEVWPGIGHHPQREAAAKLSLFVETVAMRSEKAAA